MRIAVVTPYHNEDPARLRRCHESVLSQTVQTHHLLVADGTPDPAAEQWDCDHLVLNGPHFDGGSMARGVGALQCVAQGFDAIAFLDSDNWYKPEHIAVMCDLVQSTKAQVGVGNIEIYRVDGSLIGPSAPPDATAIIDTSSFFLTRSVFPLLPLWLHLPTQGVPNPTSRNRRWSMGGLMCDRIFTYALNLFQIPIAVNPTPTVCYTAKGAVAYTMRGETPPPDAVYDEDLMQAGHWWLALSSKEKAQIICAAFPRHFRPTVE